MKNVFSVAIIAILSLTAILYSCKKQPEKLTEVKVSPTKKTRQAKPYIKVKAKPHRQNGERKSNGEPCECEFCFGLCEVKVGIGWKFKSVAIKPITDNTAKLYFIEELDETDEELIVDNSLPIPAEALEGSGISSLEILPDTYSYNSTQETIYIDDIPYLTYGYVILNIEMTE